MNLTFEGAAPADAEALADLRVVAMRESLERVGRFDPVRARERLLSSFDAEATQHIVVDGARVGFLVMRAAGGVMCLDHLYIDPRFQGRGIGAAVLAKLFARADEQDADVRVGALKSSASNRFYVRHGFELVEEDEWDLYYVRRHRAP